MPSKDKSIYYDANKTISRQRLFNFVIGARGCGKTYGFKKHVIRNFLRKGEQFVYLRRYDTELPAGKIRNFFDDVAVEFPDHSFNVWNGIFRIDDEVAGWYLPVSKAIMLKSIPFPNVSIIIYDEFIIESGVYQYLPNEVWSLLGCYSTISRDRDVPIYFLSNAVTMANPYFLYFDIKFEKGQKLYLTKFISAEIIDNNKYTDHVSKTKFGQLIAETEFGRYAVENKFVLDTDTFIEPMPPCCSYICTFIIAGKDIGFYVNKEGVKWYLSEKIDRTCPRRFTLDITEHTEQTMLTAKNNLYVSSMINKFCQGLIRFDTQSTKNICNTTLKKLI